MTQDSPYYPDHQDEFAGHAMPMPCIRRMQHLVKEIHSTPYKVVLALTGGGAEAIGELLRYGGGSSTILEAIVPYNQKSFDAFLKGKPDKYCSPGAARDLAMASFQRAIEYEGKENIQNLIGIGVCCSLTKDNEREGRKHYAYIAVQTCRWPRPIVTFEINLSPVTFTTFEGEKKTLTPTREKQENMVSRAILYILQDACLIGNQKIGFEECDTWIEENLIGNQLIIEPIDQKAMYEGDVYGLLISEAYKCLTMGCSQIVNYSRFGATDNRAIFSGSFNPFHEQHANIAKKAYEILNKSIDLEICVRNVDKPALNFINFSERAENLSITPGCRQERRNDRPGRNEGEPGAYWCEQIHFTALPTFMDKAEYFKNATFVVGWDTFVRITDPKYANIEKVLETFHRQGTKFLVFHRIIDGVNSNEKGTGDIDPRFLELATIVPPEILEPNDISSSKIRNQNNL